LTKPKSTVSYSFSNAFRSSDTVLDKNATPNDTTKTFDWSVQSRSGLNARNQREGFCTRTTTENWHVNGGSRRSKWKWPFQGPLLLTVTWMDTRRPCKQFFGFRTSFFLPIHCTVPQMTRGMRLSFDFLTNNRNTGLIQRVCARICRAHLLSGTDTPSNVEPGHTYLSVCTTSTTRYVRYRMIGMMYLWEIPTCARYYARPAFKRMSILFYDADRTSSNSNVYIRSLRF
jgi:hypothetical protein